MLIQKTQGKYLHILSSDGTLRMTVPQGTEGAIKREYETSDGKTGSKWEVVYQAIKGYISKIAIYDGDYGKVLNVRIADTEHDPITVVFNTQTNFGEDFMKKLPNIDLKKEVVIRPYSFMDDDENLRKGVAITQGTKKITSFFYDPDKKVAINGYPIPEGDTSKYDKDDWKMYYMKCRKFLISYIEDNIADKVEKGQEDTQVDQEDGIQYPAEEINPEDIPF